MPKPIKRVSLQSEIIKYIQNYIDDNQLKPGDRLPSQGQFLEMMEVSRTALREAVKTLEAEHVIEVQNGKGLFVGDQRERKNVITSLLGMNQEREQLLEILEVRRALEKEIIEMVIHRATDEELEELGGIVKVLMDKYHKGERQTEVDKEFHERMYSLCHNQIMKALIALLKEYMERFWEFPLHMEDPFAESMPYHESLYEAVRERNVPKAQKINNKLLDCVYKDIVK